MKESFLDVEALDSDHQAPAAAMRSEPGLAEAVDVPALVDNARAAVADWGKKLAVVVRDYPVASLAGSVVVGAFVGRLLKRR